MTTSTTATRLETLVLKMHAERASIAEFIHDLDTHKGEMLRDEIRRANQYRARTIRAQDARLGRHGK